MLNLRDQFSALQEAARDSEEKHKKQHQVWYDRSARDRDLAVGSQVLVLLPTSKQKLSTQWQGPYSIIKKINSVSYEVGMHDKAMSKRRFHVNMLQPYHSPNQECRIKDLELDLQNEDLPTWNQLQTMTPSIINPSLSPTQIQQIQDLLEEFQPLFSDTPGKVTGAEIHIRTGDAPPVHLPAYRISAAKYDIVRKEVSDLLQAGIITPSVASPIILVPKPDDKWRLCVDYRRLNRVTVPDPFPMPRIDEMLDCQIH